jgi:dephospho-CoA kinase
MATVQVGLTGGLASGKSALGRLLAQRGVPVVDADRLVAELYAPGAPGSRVVSALFGEEMLASDGSVDRSRLAALVFHNREALGKLERAIHPLVAKSFQKLASSMEGPVVLEATRLVEAGLADRFDGVVTVEAPESLRRQRALERGMDPLDVEARLATQGDGLLRRLAAGFLVTNFGRLADLEPAADAVVAWIRQLETEKAFPARALRPERVRQTR